MSDDNTRDREGSEQPQDQTGQPDRQQGGGQGGGGARPQTFQGLASLRQAMAAARPATQAGPGAVPDTMAPVPEDVQPIRDELGRSYATGKRKNAVARVWIKPGNGKIEVNGRDSPVYFARPVLRMLINQPFVVTDRLGQFDVFCTVLGGEIGRGHRS